MIPVSFTKASRLGLITAAGALVLVASGSAFAHHHGGGWDDDDSHYHHHHHQDGDGPGGLGPVHGPGSIHHPIVGKAAPEPNVGSAGSATIVRDHRKPKIVRDHRHHRVPTRFNLHCNKRDTSRCHVRDHRTPPPTPCYGDLC